MPSNQTTATDTPLKLDLPDFELIKVEPGSFIMGDYNSDYDREKPAHLVQIQYSFYIGKFQVTQQLYTAVMKKRNPSRFQGKRRPVEEVSWNDTKDFFTTLEDLAEVKLFKKDNSLIKFKFRLPSEAEWEYAARGGDQTHKNEKRDHYKYCGSDNLRQIGWYRDNCRGETKPVGLLFPNELGLYDLSGNVFEWCEDDWHKDYNSSFRYDDGSAWVDGSTIRDRAAYRVIRGGTYLNDADSCRLVNRYFHPPGSRDNDIGFRVVLAPVQKS